MFIALGLSALFPVVHGVMRFGIRQMDKQIGLSWVVLQGSLYILGACLYAVSQRTACCLVIQCLICIFSDPNPGAYLSWCVRYLDKLSPNFSLSGGNGYNISPLWIDQCL
jgi:predicted membrane channel-forming protein YqfA (hemolysin III family)